MTRRSLSAWLKISKNMAMVGTWAMLTSRYTQRQAKAIVRLPICWSTRRSLRVSWDRLWRKKKRKARKKARQKARRKRRLRKLDSIVSEKKFHNGSKMWSRRTTEHTSLTTRSSTHTSSTSLPHCSSTVSVVCSTKKMPRKTVQKDVKHSRTSKSWYSRLVTKLRSASFHTTERMKLFSQSALLCVLCSLGVTPSRSLARLMSHLCFFGSLKRSFIQTIVNICSKSCMTVQRVKKYERILAGL